MAALRLDRSVIRALIDHQYGGSVARLAAALPLTPAPDRSTVTRWLASDGRHFPRDAERILALAGALNVDPTALWNFHPDTFPSVWPQIVRAARTGEWGDLLKALAFLRDFIEPMGDWPVQSLARRYYGREWVVHEFAHDPRRRANFYQSLIVQADRPEGGVPSVWHVASRHGGDARTARWQLLGFIRRDRDRVVLFNDWAITDAAEAAPETSALCVRTWFGHGATSFRIASLHPFTTATADGHPAGLPTVRFGVPGEPPPES